MSLDDRTVPQDMLECGSGIPTVHAPAIRFGYLGEVAFSPSASSNDVLEHIGGVVVKFGPYATKGGAVVSCKISKVGPGIAGLFGAMPFGLAPKHLNHVTPLCVK